MDEILLGIDLGTSGAKAGLYTPDGKLLGLGRSSAYVVSAPYPGWSECDPEAWWTALIESLRDACRSARVGAERVAAVGLSVFFPAVVAMDRRGRALRPAILYNDQRSLAQARLLEESFGAEGYRRLSGNGAAPGTCAATSILWLRDHERSVFESASTFGFANTFITARLSGARATDFTHSGLSGLIDIRQLDRWDERICETLGIDPRRLPSIVAASAQVGSVSEAASRECGLRAGAPVLCGSGDAPSGSFGAGAIAPGSFSYVAGSTDCVTVPLRAPLEDQRWLTMGYVKPGIWLGIGTMSSAGASVEWFADRFYTGSRDERLAAMSAEAEEAERAGRDTVMFLPYLQGERTPVWDPLARGLFVGLTLSTTRGEMARSVFEGTALALRDVIDCVDVRATGGVKEIRAGGGPMRNRFWTQLKADALERGIAVMQFQETGSLGAALLAAAATGHYGSLEEAAAAARRAVSCEVVEPGAMSARRAARLGAYRELYTRTRSLIHELAVEESL